MISCIYDRSHNTDEKSDDGTAEFWRRSKYFLHFNLADAATHMRKPVTHFDREQFLPNDNILDLSLSSCRSTRKYLQKILATYNKLRIIHNHYFYLEMTKRQNVNNVFISRNYLSFRSNPLYLGCLKIDDKYFYDKFFVTF